MTSPRLLDEKLSQVLRAVDQAAQLARWIQRHTPRALEKKDKTPLTTADLAVQALVAGVLERTFPGDTLVAEEDATPLRGASGGSLADQVLHFVRPLLPSATAEELMRLLDLGRGQPGARFWTLDPIDGTEGFLRGGHYVVALALMEDHQPTVGMLACPTLGGPGHDGDGRNAGCMLLALAGRGTWASALDAADFERVRVSDTTDLREARMLRSFSEAHVDVEATERFVRTAGIAGPSILMDSQAKHVAIAQGDADLSVRIPADPAYREYIWDHAAGTLAIEEAGGSVTDLDGRAFDFSVGRRLERNAGIVASNGHLHPAIISALGVRRGRRG